MNPRAKKGSAERHSANGPHPDFETAMDFAIRYVPKRAKKVIVSRRENVSANYTLEYIVR